MPPVLWSALSTASCLTGQHGLSAPIPVGLQVCLYLSTAAFQCQSCLAVGHTLIMVSLSLICLYEP